MKEDYKGTKTTLGNYELISNSNTDKIRVENKDSNHRKNKQEEPQNKRTYIILKRF